MPRISSYPKDTEVSGNDIWVGSDGDNGLVTKNFSPDSLADYLVNTGRFGASTYTHTQSEASSTWTITHNLERFPDVTVVDSSGNVVVGDTTYNSNNQITLTFSTAFSGSAYLN